MPEPSLPAKRTLRCAVYTRKSTEEGLDQEFNSLDAQREAAQAFVKSQQREGWRALPAHFDDGGFTGANMDRPALRRLLDAVRAREVDCVVVYKVDRLSRSLLDFARMMSLFDEHAVSFVSVTQQFNTNNSLGRLTLHILLSFAQFERELIGERTRDKMSAARRKGKWTGGCLMLGYDVEPRTKRLIISPQEAEQVRTLYALFEKHRSLRATLAEAERWNCRLKQWICRDGDEHGGRPMNRNALRRLLTNALYAGQVCYKGVLYPGEQEAIIDLATWERVQALVRHYAPERLPRIRHAALLQGLLYCDPCGTPMILIHSGGRSGKRYRYYVCRNAREKGFAVCPSRSIAAHGIEQAVLDQLQLASASEWPVDLPDQIDRMRQHIERVGYDGAVGRVHLRMREQVQ